MLHDPDLPRLSSAELAARFGADEAALRRYRMLVALLREGRPPGEVARTFGVSRESLRRVREAYRRGGLPALKSRKTGGGHFARGSPLARALRQELGADPGMPAGVLWQRVQARLRVEGLDAPRSTFYRLLARLRDDEAAAAPGSVSLRLLRDALGALAEDPPLALGRSELATLLLPAEPDPLERGRRLQSALHAAVERLRPNDEAGPVLNDPRWRHYLIVAGEYEVGEDRAELQTALALSASTYSRAKREALERLAAVLPAALDAQPPPPPPAVLYAPPPPSGADYDAELELYAAALRREGLALIHGERDEEAAELAGDLAARLQSRGQAVVWHAARPADAEASPGHRLLRILAAALASAGERELWDILAAPGAAPEVWHFDILANALAGRHWTVVVAGTHHLEGEDAEQALDVLVTAREQRDIRLVLAGRALPPWADLDRWPALPPPGDILARQAFLARLAGRQLPEPGEVLVAGVQIRAAEIAAALTPEALVGLTPVQRAELLAALAPLAALLERLRSA
ncbi:MAG TPA: helix-turn-helix domain-containing protein [Roseiflexaceae bacterium]|nr:helix-turn-helix domain-containing protein [Roseiflexaceae bacterium]